MNSEANKYFKYLDIVREDIREELDLLGVQLKAPRICDFGCGNGITTFGLALEVDKSVCIGIDLFDREYTPNKIYQYIESLKDKCRSTQPPKKSFPGDLCELIACNRLPQFIRGNIVLNQNLPQNIDLAYCKKLMVNIWKKKHEDLLSGEERLLLGLRHIQQSIRPGGLICVLEYDQKFELEKYLEVSNLHILKRAQIKRREVRSRGRTKVVSIFTLYLCGKLT